IPRSIAATPDSGSVLLCWAGRPLLLKITSTGDLSWAVQCVDTVAQTGRQSFPVHFADSLVLLATSVVVSAAGDIFVTYPAHPGGVHKFRSTGEFQWTFADDAKALFT